VPRPNEYLAFIARHKSIVDTTHTRRGDLGCGCLPCFFTGGLSTVPNIAHMISKVERLLRVVHRACESVLQWVAFLDHVPADRDYLLLLDLTRGLLHPAGASGLRWWRELAGSSVTQPLVSCRGLVSSYSCVITRGVVGLGEKGGRQVRGSVMPHESSL